MNESSSLASMLGIGTPLLITVFTKRRRRILRLPREVLTQRKGRQRIPLNQSPASLRKSKTLTVSKAPLDLLESVLRFATEITAIGWIYLGWILRRFLCSESMLDQ
ncbi:hypothetical protein L218DRAFT_961240 [Marasmius fiardii PR-910]|nr:hypothetical protein L218DRAFT_961240 [Marasmius fiardii PR-910]